MSECWVLWTGSRQDIRLYIRESIRRFYCTCILALCCHSFHAAQTHLVSDFLSCTFFLNVLLNSPWFFQDHGGSLHGCDIRRCSYESSHSSLSPGLGLFCTSRSDAICPLDQSTAITDPQVHGDEDLMTVPLSLIISKHTATRCPLFGRHLSAMVDADIIDDRSAVLLFLALHRELGQGSPYCRQA